MLARFRVLLPYDFHFPHRASLPAFDFTFEGYEIIAYAPKQANTDSSVCDIYSLEPILSAINELDEKLIVEANDILTINGRETVRANMIQLDIHSKNDFAREKNDVEIDPPVETMFRAANFYIERLRTVGRIPHARALASETVLWKIEYLNDDGSPLERDETKRRKLDSTFIDHKTCTITEEVWSKVTKLSQDYVSPIWDTLILDAIALNNEINASIVLANAAIESCVDYVLARLVTQSNVSGKSWEWISKRNDDFAKQPSIKEKFDEVLYLICGFSFKTDVPDLWRSLIDLRDARNSIVHEGRGFIGKKKKRVPLNSEMVRVLLLEAQKIISKLDSLLPEDERRPIVRRPINIAFRKHATGEKVDPDSAIIGIKKRTNIESIKFVPWDEK